MRLVGREIRFCKYGKVRGHLKKLLDSLAGSLLVNRDLNLLAVHSALQQVAAGIVSAFSAVFLLRQGFSVSAIFLCLCVIIVLRLLFRPATAIAVRAIGLRPTLIIGTFLYAVQGPLLAPVHGLNAWLVSYCVAAALAQAFYWATYHAMFAVVGSAAERGSQVGWRQLVIAFAGPLGPAMGGLMLTLAGPWAAFGTAAVVELAAVVPLLEVSKPSIAATVPDGAFAFYRRGVLLLGSDGWIFCSSSWAWSMIMFQALSSRYDAYGGVLAVLAVVGALSGLALGHLIDRGHARRAAMINATALAATLVARVVCGSSVIAVLVVAFGTTLLSGLYLPSLMTAIYNEAKASPCPFRFHFAAEVGWDSGGALACLIAAVLCATGLSLHAVIALALPMVAFQALVLDASYAARKLLVAAVETDLPTR
jgi:MFS transporter, DHA1 family, inner membrane transport protein